MPKKLVLFDELEDDKENYSYQRKGRSVSLISQLKTTSKTSDESSKNEYWKQILNQISLVDDPLSLFVEYIEIESHKIMSDWTLKRSNLLEIVELCLLYCQRFDRYKNDPKYLNVWLDYCSNFYSTEDQINIFYYMYRSDICVELSDFYSYFTDIFVLLERYFEAYQVLNLGIQANAKPEKQLLDELNLLKENENFKVSQVDRTADHDGFQNSNQNNHPAFQINYHEPNLILNQERNDLIRNYQNRIIRNNSQARTKNQNLNNLNPSSSSIYRDENDEANDTFNVFKSSVHNILDDKSIVPLATAIASTLKFESRNEKFKENKHLISGRIEPNSEIEPLKQVASMPLNQPKVNNKLSIFNDTMHRNGPIYKILHVSGMKPEKIDCNFNLIYTEDGTEHSIEEILALIRYGKIINTTNNNKRSNNDNDNHNNNNDNFTNENGPNKKMKM